MINSSTNPLYTTHHGSKVLLNLLLCSGIRSSETDLFSFVQGQLPNNLYVSITHLVLDEPLYRQLVEQLSSEDFGVIRDTDVANGAIDHYLNISLVVGRVLSISSKDGYFCVLVNTGGKSKLGNSYVLFEFKTLNMKFPDLKLWD